MNGEENTMKISHMFNISMDDLLAIRYYMNDWMRCDSLCAHFHLISKDKLTYAKCLNEHNTLTAYSVKIIYLVKMLVI